MMTYNAERVATPHDAINLGLAFCKKRGLTPAFTFYGDLMRTCRCVLEDRCGVRAVGRGKGLDEQSQASALFESIEHYFYENENLQQKLLQLRLDLEGADERLALLCPRISLLSKFQEATLSRLVFKSIRGNLSIAFPAFLLNPDFKPPTCTEHGLLTQRRLVRYSTNSGTAAGLDEAEAVLHGMLELIERDSLGLCLIKCVIKKFGITVKTINHQSLPHNLRSIVELAIKETKGSITLFDITSDLGIPTVLAEIDRQVDGVRPYYATGASLSKAYAVERAVLEAVQCSHIYDCEGLYRPSLGERPLSSLSMYQRCFLEFGYFFPRFGREEIAFTALGGNDENIESLPPHRQVEYIANILNGRTIRIYTRAISIDQVHVWQVVSPELERFHLVSMGNPVLPGPRGTQMLS